MNSCAGLCYLCLEPVELPHAQSRCTMRKHDDCRRRQMQREADDWYAAEVARMAERAPA